MYEKLNHSPETHEENKVMNVEKRKFKLTKEQADKNTKFRKNGLWQARGTKLVQTTRMSGKSNEMCQMWWTRTLCQMLPLKEKN